MWGLVSGTNLLKAISCLTSFSWKLIYTIPPFNIENQYCTDQTHCINFPTTTAMFEYLTYRTKYINKRACIMGPTIIQKINMTILYFS